MILENLKITAHMVNKIVTYEDGLPIDSLLQWGAYVLDGKPRVLDQDPVLRYELPLKKMCSDKPWWFWSASFAQYNIIQRSVYHANRSFPMERKNLLSSKIKSINVAATNTRSTRIPLPAILVDKIVWYCVGNKDKIELLLREVKHIGRKHTRGLGQVNKWIVEPFDKNWSIIGPNNRLMRAVPYQFMDKQHERSMFPIVSGIRPPYWHPDNKIDAILPDM